MALRELAEERVAIELLVPRPEFSYRPLAVAEPFGLGEGSSFDLEPIAGDHGASLRIGTLSSVDVERAEVSTTQGNVLPYDLLVVAVGAKLEHPFPDSVMIMGPGYTGQFRQVLEELRQGSLKRVAFAVPSGASWPLPLYELALMTAALVAEEELDGVELKLITPEDAPLDLFGAEASHEVRALLAERGIELRTGAYPTGVADGALEVRPVQDGAVPADRVVTLPRLVGPRVSGLPQDRDGFIPTDEHCQVRGADGVYAAGDATAWSVKQGGLASQQADAAAEAIAARVGAPVEAAPYRPVLRGMLLTGSAPRYLRSEVSGGRGPDEVSQHALWWPPSKVVGRRLAPYLAAHAGLAEPPGPGRSVELPL